MIADGDRVVYENDFATRTSEGAVPYGDWRAVNYVAGQLLANTNYAAAAQFVDDDLQDNWIKASVEYENEEFQHLGSVVTNHGYSDWATTAIPADVKVMWYRLSRRADDYRVECSTDGVTFDQMRVCHLWEGAGTVRFGIYACSPEDSSFTAEFTDFAVTECAWKAHDGQQPDEA